MSTASYNCPCCGGPLTFSGKSGKLECVSCGNSFEPEALEMLNTAESGEQIVFERPKEGFQAGEEGVQIYHCKNCGAELMTEDTTTAAECPYCGSPTILPDRLEGGVKPEKVIPFVVTKEQAQKQFEDYFKGKRLLPNIFLNSRNRIAEMRRLYVPYWLFDCEARGDIVYDAQTTTTEQEGEWEVSRTRHYLVRRRGQMSFENIPVDGSVKLDDKITESLEPYDLSAAIPFQSAVLALQFTRDMLEPETLAAAAQLLMNARKIVIFGLGGSAPVAMDLHHKLLRLGLNAAVYTDPHLQVIACNYLDERDAVFAVSHSGSSRCVVDSTQTAKHRGAKVISLTSAGKNPLSKLADISLNTNSKETKYRVVSIASRVAALTIADSIYTYIAMRTDGAKSLQIEKSMESLKY